MVVLRLKFCFKKSPIKILFKSTITFVILFCGYKYNLITKVKQIYVFELYGIANANLHANANVHYDQIQFANFLFETKITNNF